MKKVILLLIFTIIGYSGVKAQTFEYSYDASGNRVLRQIISLIKKDNNDTNNIIKTNQYNIYPNPVTDILNIEILNENTGTVTFTLLDMQGRVIQEFSTLNNNSVINLSELNPGAYILYITTNNEKKEWKIIKD